MSVDDWDRWADDWRASAATPSPDVIRALAVREEQRLRRTRYFEAGVALAGIAGVGAALFHTHDAPDVITAAVTVVGLGILLLFGRSAKPDYVGSIAGSTTEFIAASRRRVGLQLRVISFIWAAIALDLVFFLPWWISGYTVHRSELDAPIMLASWWFPLVTLLGLVAWSVVFRRRLGAEYARLGDLETAYREN